MWPFDFFSLSRASAAWTVSSSRRRGVEPAACATVGGAFGAASAGGVDCSGVDGEALALDGGETEGGRYLARETRVAADEAKPLDQRNLPLGHLLMKGDVKG